MISAFQLHKIRCWYETLKDEELEAINYMRAINMYLDKELAIKSLDLAGKKPITEYPFVVYYFEYRGNRTGAGSMITLCCSVRM